MFQAIKRIISEGNTFLITSHIDPDGDAIGSAFSLYWALESLGKRPVVYLSDEVPYKYDFLPLPPRFTRVLPDENFDAVFVLDCGNLFRVGPGYEHLRDMGQLVNIDHHQTNEAFGVANVIDENACSTGEILYSLYESVPVPVSSDMALDIYTAILTDTGSFRYENTNARAFAISAKLLETGLKPSYVSQMVYSSHPKERFKLLGLALSELETFNGGTVAMTYITADMFKKTNATKELSDGFVELVKEIRGVEVAAVLREIPEGYKISLRSKGKVDVAGICSIFGGGGHKNAAGCTIRGDLNEAKKRLKEALQVQ